MPPRLDVGAVYRDAWRVYRLLFRRSVLTGAIVFGFVALIDVADRLVAGRTAAVVFGFALFALSIAASPFVQGALIEIVRNIHEGRAAKPIGALYARARSRFWPLVGASILYGLGVLFGLILLIVPGLLAASRWSLMAPFVVLEDEGVSSALGKSSDTVRENTASVLWIVLLTFVITATPAIAVNILLLDSAFSEILFSFVWSSLTAPFSAHVLTVVYYRLTDPDRPVIHEAVASWRSVWEGA